MSNEKAEKSKTISQIKHVPKDAQVVMSILKELNIQEYEPRVVNQLLEFTYRYVTCILDDAKVFANHARKKTIDLDDVKLATEMVLEKAFTNPPSRHVLAKLAEVRNAMPLPPIKPHCGLRLPPDRYCLSAVNYKLRSANQPKKMTKSALEGRSTIKTNVKSVSSANTLKRPHAAISKQQVVTIPKPIIKFTTVTTKTTTTTAPTSAATSGITKIEPNTSDSAGLGTDIKMEIDQDAASAVGSIGIGGGGSTSSAVKREREDEEFTMV